MILEPVGKMSFKNVIKLSSLLILFFYSQAFGLEQSVKAELLTSVKTVAPGEKFYVGIKLSMNDPWHVYWKYPGESGLPTRISYKTQEDLSIYPFKWPTPIRFSQPGGDDGFGYEREVLLISEVVAAEDLDIGKKIPIEATVDWLGCSPRLCMPGKAKLNTEVKIGRSTTPSKGETFSNWLKLVPEPIEECQGADSYKIDGNKISDDQAKVTISLDWKKGHKVLDWILALSEEYDVNSSKINNINDKSIINLVIKRRKGMKVTEPVLDSVAVIQLPDGSKKGVLIPISTGL